MNRIAKIFAAFIIGIQAIPMLIFLFIQLYKLSVKFEMQHALTVSKLEKYIIEPSQIKWVEEGREMVINGVMFDVYSFQKLPNGSIEVYGLTDHHEQNLNNQSNQLLKTKKHLQTFLVKLIVVQSIGLIESVIDSTAKIKIFRAYFFSPSVIVKLIYQEVICPPPQSLTP